MVGFSGILDIIWVEKVKIDRKELLVDLLVLLKN